MHNNFLRYNPNIIWSLPVLFQYEPVWINLFNILKEHNISLPKIFAYGCPECAWTGGRGSTIMGEFTSSQLAKLFDLMNQLNAQPTIAFNNSQITKDNLKDPYCNLILNTALYKNASYIVFSDDLKDYIKSKDSNAVVISSVIKAIEKFQNNSKSTFEDETKYYNELLKEYDIVNVRPEYSKNVLAKHPEVINDISRVQILINQDCPQNCPLAMDRFHFIENNSITDIYENKVFFECPKEKTSTTLHTQKEVEILIENGVKHINLLGRGSTKVMEAICMMIFSNIFNVENSMDIFRKILEISFNQESSKFINEIFHSSSC